MIKTHFPLAQMNLSTTRRYAIGEKEVTRENSGSLANEMRRIMMGEGMNIFYIYNTSSGTEYALFLIIILFHCLALIRRHSYPPG
jgi:hypothetical protein